MDCAFIHREFVLCHMPIVLHQVLWYLCYPDTCWSALNMWPLSAVVLFLFRVLQAVLPITRGKEHVMGNARGE